MTLHAGDGIVYGCVGVWVCVPGEIDGGYGRAVAGLWQGFVEQDRIG